METLEITKDPITQTIDVSQELMTPEERGKLKSLKRIKEHIQGTKETIPYYKICKEYGLTSNWAATLVRMNIVKRTASGLGHQMYYAWIGGEPNRQMVKDLDKNKRAYQREVQKKSGLRKKEEKRRIEEEKRALRLLEARKQKEKIETRKNEGKILDPSDVDLVNTLKAKSEGLTEEKILAKVEQKNIPITVNVTTEGNKKTVCIQIEV